MGGGADHLPFSIAARAEVRSARHWSTSVIAFARFDFVASLLNSASMASMVS